MTLKNTAQLAIDLLKKQQISDYEIVLNSNSGISTIVRLGEVETLQHHLSRGFDVNVFIGQKKGSASSVDFSPSGLEKTIKSACLIAKYTQDDKFNGLADKSILAFETPDLDLYHPWDLDPKTSIDLAKECEESALSEPDIDNSDGAEISSFQGENLYANSHDFTLAQKSTKHSISVSLIAKSGDDMQTAYEYSSVLDPKDLEKPHSIGVKAAKLAREKLGAKSIKSQKCPVIFTSRLSNGLFSSLLSALSGSAQYKKSSFLPDSIGQKVMPSGVDLTELPFAKKTLGARVADDNGVLKREQDFIKDGRVTQFVMGQYSANQLGLKTTANAGGVSNPAVSANFQGGTIEMIKSLKKGLVVTELMGQGVNSITGDYSRGASGFWVENGVILHPVSGLTIAGNLKDMLLNIEQIGDDIDHRSNIKVGSVLVGEMTIAG